MVYRRSQRPTFYMEAKTRTGFKQVCTHARDKKLAQRIEHMWAELAAVRAWDLLEPVLDGAMTIGALYDRWSTTRADLAAMRFLANDADVTPFVAEWFAVYVTQVERDTAEHALAHVRQFFPLDVVRLMSSVTADWLATGLSRYAGRRNTRRKVHSSLSGFFDYLVTVKKLFPASPMLHVDRPKQQFAPPTFYSSPDVTRIVGWQPTPARKAFFALIYGTGGDVTPVVTVERDAFNPATKEVRIAGTKTAFRDRVVRVNDALWPVVWAHVKTVIAGPVFPSDWNRYTVSDWHRQTVGTGVKDTHGRPTPGLKLAKRLPLRKARHHFAVRLLESGAAIRVVAEQLGSDERTVLKYYGPWITSSEDRSRAEKMAGKHETKRRSAQ